MRSERWFWAVGIVLGAAGVYVGLRLFLDQQWLASLATPRYRSRSFAAGLAVIMLAVLGFCIRNLIQSFKKPNYDDRPY